ncbi:hypothetical protein CAMSH0001_0253 [Campylobacter showae RM3277]|uniref:Uncharacterized protein n=1 Tax=Campylobacter showae RM3277 TaxID=553219 RepID=C6RIA1_9BACT|nr:hypothetical protein CAMSH0001_0253 [Campylobacter showae RM3277]
MQKFNINNHKTRIYQAITRLFLILNIIKIRILPTKLKYESLISRIFAK